MTKAVIVPFFRYGPDQRGNNKLLFKFFLKHLRLWAKEIDHLYIIDSGPTISPEDQQAVRSLVKTTIYSLSRNSHWDNLNKYIPMITENKFLLIDSDTIIYNADVIRKIFEGLDNYDVVSLTDTSGGNALYKKYPIFDENESRSVRNRFGPYLFACRKDFWNRLGAFDFTPVGGPVNWTDSMGSVSEQILALNPRFKELPDDRVSVLWVEGRIEVSAFLDSSHHLWSKPEQHNYGYYHIRNYSGGLKLVEAKAVDTADYNRHKSIMPRQEGLRLLAWLWFIAGDASYQREIIKIVDEFGVAESQFLEYLEKFKGFHSWLGDIV